MLLIKNSPFREKERIQNISLGKNVEKYHFGKPAILIFQRFNHDLQ